MSKSLVDKNTEPFDYNYKVLSKIIKSKQKQPVAREFDLGVVYEVEQLKLKLQEYEKIMKLRDEWSTIFKGTLIAIVIFEMGITLSVGLNLLNFRDYEWLINIVVLGGFAQILAMPFTVAKFLFSKESSNFQK